MASDHRLFWTISDYLCTECKAPLYIETSTEPNDICPNDQCILHEPDLKFQDITKADKLREEMKNRRSQLHRRIAETNRLSLIDYLYGQRLTIITESVKTFKIDFRKWLAIDDLLIYVSSNLPSGNERNLQTLQSIFSDYRELFDIKCFIEDVENERHLISTDNKCYTLKYWLAILDFYKTHGIVVGWDKPISEAFRYSHIEKKVKENVKLRFGEDWGKYFQQMFDFIINLGYMFEYQYFTANQHRYNPTGIDIATILGLWLSARQRVEAWPRQDIERHFERTSGGRESFERFHEKYMSGISLAPVVVCNGKDYLFDRYTTLLYAMYLIGINERMSQGQIKPGVRLIAAKREEASGIFEARVRERLKMAGFAVPNGSLRVKEQNEEQEYDAIGVNEAKSQVIIAEAKYRDFAPSSISGKTLIKQELLDEDRLLDWASEARNKLEFFRKHGARFKRELFLGKDANSYDTGIWVVTKHKPLISKYRSVQIVDFPEFCRRFPPKPN